VGSERARPVVLDTGALIAFERNDRRVRTLIELALANRGELHVPAGVVAQAWRDGARQARVARLLSSGSVAVTALDDEEARAVGVLCRKTGAFDVIDASVALLAAVTPHASSRATRVTSGASIPSSSSSCVELVVDIP
jgi:hypothetical protein